MKKFTDTHKKWALTATMIAALGCSVSFNSQHTANFSADLASEAEDLMVPTKVTINKKEIKVRLVKLDDKQTTVLVPPQKDSEGKIQFECSDCSTFVITKKLRDDVDTIAEFQDEIVKKLTTAKEEKKEVVKVAADVKEERKTSGRRGRVAREDRDDDIRSSVDDEEADLISYIDETCASKASEKTAGRIKRRGVKKSGKSMTCVTNAFLDYVNDPDVEISESVASKFYKEKLERKILSQIMSGSRDQDADRFAESNDGFKTIDVLLAELPSDMNTLRKRIVLTSTKAVASSAAEARQLLATATQTRRNVDFQFAVNKLNETNRLAEDLRIVNQDGLFNPDNGEDNVLSFNAAGSIYNSAFGQYWEGMKSSIAKAVPAQAFTNPGAINVSAFQIPNIDLSNTGVAQFNNISGALVAPGYNESNSGANWGNNGGVHNNNGQGVLIAPQQMQQNTSNGTQFGQPRQVSPDALRAAQQIRSQQGQSMWVQQ